MKKAVIVDIDGTLSNCEHRRHFMETKRKDWKNFYDLMYLDTPNKWCVDIIFSTMALVRTNPFEITQVILVSGRPDNYRDITEKWLKLYKIPYSVLLMRREGDNRQDRIVKLEIYEKEIKAKGFEVSFVLDDRKQCVDMWREQGLVCLQCAEGNF